MSNFQDVLDFHEKFGLPCAETPKVMPTSMLEFRRKFLDEEVEEYREAYRTMNLIAATDALLDLVYVAIGTALFIGMPRRDLIGTWPAFADVKAATIAYGFVLPKKPELLTAYINSYFEEIFTVHIRLFAVAHSAAVCGEANGLVFALGNLKRIVRKCYMAATLMGVPWNACWQHVQSANMAKVRAGAEGDSKRRSLWDVVKPTGWKAPDMFIAHELAAVGWTTAFEYNHATGKIIRVIGDV